MDGMQFTRFAAIDWSGAKGRSHPGIALAICEAGNAAPSLVHPPGRYWSREAIRDWILARAAEPLLIGFDMSFCAPVLDRGAYLPGESTATDARAFWNWEFLGPAPDLPQTRAMLMRACDVRLPTRLTEAELDYIARALIGSAEQVRG